MRGYGSRASAEALDHLRTLGVGWVSLTPFGWMGSVHDASIEGEHTGAIPDAAESSKRLRDVVAQLRARDFGVVLKPHIWIRGGAWRGAIAPRDEEGAPAWRAWWRSYDAFILYYARLAAELDIEQLVVGVELDSALDHDLARFEQTIESVRRVYDGELVYAANWNERRSTRLWEKLDRVGVQFYPPLSEAREPGLSELREALGARLAGWRQTARRADRPLVLSEVGYRAAADAVEQPFEWPERADERGRTVDRALQARAYRALFAELADAPEVGGVYVWKYFTDASTAEREEWGFALRDNPAEEVLRRAYGAPEEREGGEE